ncbi:histidine phosphatase family protein [Clostridium sp. HV4-5-A1G]|uniref:histidine phosphatase family protein n=1 Tax=Clostridium sp. HV4-5-A1G TaxID=2004595 RepID=UPI00123BA12C|nr:histidine phosphatase family protein [Clostridium sp. HV4-5-A1G]KAA8678814.1 histidine phosphatase family protein [Clostridium sp. HV4-5-A1G]
MNYYRKIYLVRHGSVGNGNEKRYVGNTDLPLCREGILQCKKLQRFFSTIDIERAYLSPLKRCVQTADIILKYKNIDRIMIEEFKEINMGKWEGKTFTYVKKLFPDEFKKRGESIETFVPQGGESFEQLQKRVIPKMMNIIENSTGDIMIITHAGVNRVILCHILSIPLYHIFKIKQNYGCINELCWNDEEKNWVKEKFNLNM